MVAREVQRVTRWVMCCPHCKAKYAYSEEPSQAPKFGMVPAAKYWRYMDGQSIQPGALFYCAECNSHFYPMIEDVIEENQMRMDELTARILGWAHDRNLIEGSTVEKQFVKLVEEVGELAAGLARGKTEVVDDALGDIMVIAIIMCAQRRRTPPEILEAVWDIIKDRKGRMVDGVFIKENDAMMLTGGNAQG